MHSNQQINSNPNSFTKQSQNQIQLYSNLYKLSLKSSKSIKKIQLEHIETKQSLHYQNSQLSVLQSKQEQLKQCFSNTFVKQDIINSSHSIALECSQSQLSSEQNFKIIIHLTQEQTSNKLSYSQKQISSLKSIYQCQATSIFNNHAQFLKKSEIQIQKKPSSSKQLSEVLDKSNNNHIRFLNQIQNFHNTNTNTNNETNNNLNGFPKKLDTHQKRLKYIRGVMRLLKFIGKSAQCGNSSQSSSIVSDIYQSDPQTLGTSNDDSDDQDSSKMNNLNAIQNELQYA